MFCGSVGGCAKAIGSACHGIPPPCRQDVAVVVVGGQGQVPAVMPTRPTLASRPPTPAPSTSVTYPPQAGLPVRRYCMEFASPLRPSQRVPSQRLCRARRCRWLARSWCDRGVHADLLLPCPARDVCPPGNPARSYVKTPLPLPAMISVALHRSIWSWEGPKKNLAASDPREGQRLRCTPRRRGLPVAQQTERSGVGRCQKVLVPTRHVGVPRAAECFAEAVISRT